MLVEKIEEQPIIWAFDVLKLREVLRGPGAPSLPYSASYLEVGPRQSSWPHHLTNGKTEVYIMLEGKGLVHVGNEESVVEGLCAIPILPEQTQFIENLGDTILKVLCLVSPPWRKEDEVLEKR